MPGSRELSLSSRSSIPWGAAGMLAILVVVELFVDRHWLDLTDPVSLSWRYSAQAAESDLRDCQLLCLGDSLVKHGLVPSVIERTSGQKTVNISAARASTLLSYRLLRRALDSGCRPKALIVNAKPAVLLGGPEFNARQWQEVLSLRDAIELLQVTRNAPFVLSTAVGRLLPSLRARLEIQSAVIAAIQGNPDRICSMNPVLWRNWSVNEGANIAPATSAYRGDLSAEVERQLYTDIFFVDPANAEAIEQILKLAAARRIPLFWVLCPLSPSLQAQRELSGADELHDRFLRSLVARYPGVVTVLDARRAGYSAQFFADPTHLNRLGALALSRSVAVVLSTRVPSHQPPPSNSGWIRLDHPPESPGEWADQLEDVEQSKRIVDRDTATRVSSR
jgi:hypothetical protein